MEVWGRVPVTAMDFYSRVLGSFHSITAKRGFLYGCAGALRCRSPFSSQMAGIITSALLYASVAVTIGDGQALGSSKRFNRVYLGLSGTITEHFNTAITY